MQAHVEKREHQLSLGTTTFLPLLREETVAQLRRELRQDLVRQFTGDAGGEDGNGGGRERRGGSNTARLQCLLD